MSDVVQPATGLSEFEGVLEFDAEARRVRTTKLIAACGSALTMMYAAAYYLAGWHGLALYSVFFAALVRRGVWAQCHGNDSERRRFAAVRCRHSYILSLAVHLRRGWRPVFPIGGSAIRHDGHPLRGRCLVVGGLDWCGLLIGDDRVGTAKLHRSVLSRSKCFGDVGHSNRVHCGHRTVHHWRSLALLRRHAACARAAGKSPCTHGVTSAQYPSRGDRPAIEIRKQASC